MVLIILYCIGFVISSMLLGAFWEGGPVNTLLGIIMAIIWPYSWTFLLFATIGESIYRWIENR